ncbi:hypothetical protein D4Q76_02705 [archaeon]|nr:MAG: hypothetical protein D4Q76_02705 [archaeon]
MDIDIIIAKIVGVFSVGLSILVPVVVAFAFFGSESSVTLHKYELFKNYASFAALGLGGGFILLYGFKKIKTG